MDRVADGGQRVPKLVAHHRHELIFAVIRLFGGLERVPQLPSGRRELGEGPDDPLILPVELPFIGMAHDPHRSHRPAVNPKRNEQGLDKARLRPQGRKVTIRQVHQLGDILIDAHAATAGRTGHRTVPVRSEHPGHRFPSKHVSFEEADTGRIGSSAVSTSFWSMLRGFSVISRASTASARSRPSESGSRGGVSRARSEYRLPRGWPWVRPIHPYVLPVHERGRPSFLYLAPQRRAASRPGQPSSLPYTLDTPFTCVESVPNWTRACARHEERTSPRAAYPCRRTLRREL